MKRIHILTAASAVFMTSATLAQTNVSPLNKFSWTENCGWMNWRDAGSPLGSQGARFHPTFVSGFVWGENIGWINLGDGTPANGVAYAYATGADFGVNITAVTGNLTGLAWGENIGWINFTLPTLPAAQRPRLDTTTDRLLGYAWGENIGWINLDDATHFAGVNLCSCDFNADGFLNSQDFFDFLTAFFSLTPTADFNNDGFINSQDFFDFLSCFFVGC